MLSVIFKNFFGYIQVTSTISLFVIHLNDYHYLLIPKKIYMIRSLNLDAAFLPTKYLSIPFEMLILPGGELHPKLSKKIQYSKLEKVIITQRANNSNSIFAILFAADALRRVGVERLELVMPYIPYARQDRYDQTKHFGESFTLDLFTDILNLIEFNKVYVLDAHSDVSKGMIKKCWEYDMYEYVDRMLMTIFPGDPIKTRFNLIKVDAGVSKKIDNLATYLYSVGWLNFEIIQCEKKRDIPTGNIIGFKVFSENLYKHPTVLVDDICDGGNSFIYAAEELLRKNCGQLYGFFSHGIFSQGYDKLLSYYEHLFTTNSIKDIDYKGITQFKFEV